MRLPSHDVRMALGALLASLALASGCDWVDSTGVQADDAVPVALAEVAPGEALPLIEGSTRRLVVGATDDGDVYGWSEAPLAEGALDSCTAVEGFRPGLAAATLEEACSDADACGFPFEENVSSAEGDAGAEELGFRVDVPTLRASVGLRYRLSVETADGRVGSTDYDFCLIAVNEAPEALDDGPYTVTEGTPFVLAADAPDNLLANDSDDDDVGNLGLAIEPVAERAPTAAADFELGSDGGFRYTFADTGLRGSFTDSFAYALSDGVNDPVTATVTLTVVPRNLPPVLALPIEPIEAFVGVPLRANLAGGFSDPEGEPLSFALRDEASLPASGSLALSPDGVLRGEPLAGDVGDYEIVFAASDGFRETETRVNLSVTPPPNSPPRYVAGSSGDIVLARFVRVSLPLAAFADPEDDPLTYELVGQLPFGLSFDEDTAELSGRPALRGIFRGLRVRATDPDGATGVSIEFSLRVI